MNIAEKVNEKEQRLLLLNVIAIAIDEPARVVRQCAFDAPVVDAVSRRFVVTRPVGCVDEVQFTRPLPLLVIDGVRVRIENQVGPRGNGAEIVEGIVRHVVVDPAVGSDGQLALSESSDETVTHWAPRETRSNGSTDENEEHERRRR